MVGKIRLIGILAAIRHLLALAPLVVGLGLTTRRTHAATTRIVNASTGEDA